MAENCFFFDHREPEVHGVGHEVSHYNPYEVCTIAWQSPISSRDDDSFSRLIGSMGCGTREAFPQVRQLFDGHLVHSNFTCWLTGKVDTRTLEES